MSAVDSIYLCVSLCVSAWVSVAVFGVKVLDFVCFESCFISVSANTMRVWCSLSRYIYPVIHPIYFGTLYNYNFS